MPVIVHDVSIPPVDSASSNHRLMGRDYEKIQIVTIREMLENGKKRLDMPLSFEVLK
jgi:hypothetical protein